MLKRFAVAAVLMAMSLPGHAADDVATVERLGMQAYAALLCWPADANETVSLKHHEYFKRKTAALMSIMDAAPAEQQQKMADKLYIGFYGAYTYRRESIAFRQGFMLANTASLVSRLREDHPGNKRQEFETKTLCSTLDLDS